MGKAMDYKKPKRFFEKSGIVDPKASYYVQLENVTNMDNQDLKTMVDRGRYFSIFAPIQSGKTTFLEGFCLELGKDSPRRFSGKWRHKPTYLQ